MWDKSLVKEGKAHCWNPHPINTWNLVIASKPDWNFDVGSQVPQLTSPSGYWAFLDFALALIPVDMVWKLQLTIQKKLLLSCLLGMGVL